MAGGTQQRQQAPADIRVGGHHQQIVAGACCADITSAAPQESGADAHQPHAAAGAAVSLTKVEARCGIIEVDVPRPHPIAMGQPLRRSAGSSGWSTTVPLLEVSSNRFELLRAAQPLPTGKPPEQAPAPQRSWQGIGADVLPVVGDQQPRAPQTQAAKSISPGDQLAGLLQGATAN